MMIKCEFTKDQMAGVKWLMDHAWVCSGCGRGLKMTDAKFPLGILPPPSILRTGVPSHFSIAGYCFGCAMKINGLLKDLKRLMGMDKLLGGVL